MQQHSHAPIVPRSVHQRAADELWLRGQYGVRGGERFGSREALMGRVLCRCGLKMKKLRRLETVYRCDKCKLEIPEAELKRRVMAAVNRLPRYRNRIEALISGLPLSSSDRLERARAQRQEWRLMNLLPLPEQAHYTPDCTDETDFRARTAKRITEWSDDALVRIIDHLEVDGPIHFKGGLVVEDGDGEK